MRRFKAPMFIAGNTRSLGYIVDGAVVPARNVPGCGSVFFVPDTVRASPGRQQVARPVASGHCLVDLSDGAVVPEGWQHVGEVESPAPVISHGLHSQNARLKGVDVARAAREVAAAKARAEAEALALVVAAAKAVADAEARALADAEAAAKAVADVAAATKAYLEAEAAREAEAKAAADAAQALVEAAEAEAKAAAEVVETPEVSAEAVIVEEEENFNSENPAPDEVLATLPETDAPPPKKPAKKRKR